MKIKLLCSGIACLLLTACASSINSSGINTSEIKPDSDGMVLIPAGEFTMGSNKKEGNVSMFRDANALNPYGFDERLYVDERPAHQLTLPAFRIDQYEVTNAQYRKYTTETKHAVPITWRENAYDATKEILLTLSLDVLRQLAANNFRLDMDASTMNREALLVEMEKANAARDNFPVTMVSWSDAYDYCYWAGKRLPTEAEWEKAARGPQGFEYPWGNTWDPKKINTMSNDSDIPYSPVGSFPGDKSDYGVYDMASNVAEWVRDWYQAYPDALPADANSNYGRVQRVIRGGMASSGHYDSMSIVFRNARRMHYSPNSTGIDLGFRCAKNVESPSAQSPSAQSKTAQ